MRALSSRAAWCARRRWAVSSTSPTGRTSSTPRTARSGITCSDSCPFNDYRHRVDIMIEGKVLNWPMLVSDIDEQSDSEQIRAELAEREGVDAERARGLGQLRGVVPRADGPHALRALHLSLHEEAVGPRATAAERNVGAAPRAAAARQRPVPVPGSLSGLARRQGGLHRSDRGTDRAPLDRAGDRTRPWTSNRRRRPLPSTAPTWSS